MKHVSKIITSFNVWFCSANAIWQTFLATCVWVALEIIFPKLDPNGFIMLYILTILSFVTQPMLAYAANVSAQKSEESQQLMQQLLINSVHTMNGIITMMEAQEKVIKQQTNMINKLNKLVGQLKDKVEDIEEELMDEKGEDKL